MAGKRAVAALELFPYWPAVSGGRIVVACSGGPDSTALACAVAEFIVHPAHRALWAAAPPRLMLWHLDHLLRETSARDAEFVKRLGGQLGAEAIIEREDIGAQARERRMNVEALARERRYALLDQHCSGSCGTFDTGASFAFTAHSMNDHAETVLMRLLRGAHAQGLLGIADEYNERIFRPWLGVSRAEIMEYLASIEQDYVVDESNTDLSRTRNAIRYKVLPLLQQLSPRAVERVARLSEIAAHAVAFAQSAIAEMSCTRVDEAQLARCLPLAAKPCGHCSAHIAVFPWWQCPTINEYVRQELARHNIGVNAEQMALLNRVAFIQPQPVWVNGWSARVPAEHSLLLSGPLEEHAPPEVLPLKKSGWVSNGLVELRLEKASSADWTRGYHNRDLDGLCALHSWPEMMESLYLGPPETAQWECFLLDSVQLPLAVRTWRQGDRLRLRGGGSKKLSDIFIDAKVPSAFRRAWIVLVDAAGEVLWLPGLADSIWMAAVAGPPPAYQVRIIANPPFDAQLAADRASLVLDYGKYDDRMYDRALKYAPDEQDDDRV